MERPGTQEAVVPIRGWRRPLLLAANPVRALGSLGLFSEKLLRATPRLWGRELARQLWEVGAKPLPLAFIAAMAAGVMMVLQSASTVRMFGVTSLMGWATGYASLREFVPLTVAIIFTGRVGASQAAELAALGTGEQLTGLKALGVNVAETLLAPRLWAVVGALVLVTGLCDLVALGTASLFCFWLMEVPPQTFFEGMVERLRWGDAFAGLEKALFYGLAIGLSALTAGLGASGGARGVGRAARQAVLRAMVAILLLDALLTGLG